MMKDCDRFLLRIDLGNLWEIADIQPILTVHPFHCLQEQVLSLLDDSSDMVGQATVGKGDILPFFKENNVILFI